MIKKSFKKLTLHAYNTKIKFNKTINVFFIYFIITSLQKLLHAKPLVQTGLFKNYLDIHFTMTFTSLKEIIQSSVIQQGRLNLVANKEQTRNNQQLPIHTQNLVLIAHVSLPQYIYKYIYILSRDTRALRVSYIYIYIYIYIYNLLLMHEYLCSVYIYIYIYI